MSVVHIVIAVGLQYVQVRSRFKSGPGALRVCEVFCMDINLSRKLDHDRSKMWPPETS